MKKEYLKDDPKQRTKFKVLGFLFLIPGLICMLIAFVDFFSAMNSFEGPDKFWLFFVGMPLIFVGLTCLRLGYMGQMARYTSSQISPVVKDTANYLIDGTKDEIIDVVNGIRGTKETKKECPSCGEKNDHDALFCDNCGAKLSKACSRCETINESDAKYCKKCGNRLY